MHRILAAVDFSDSTPQVLAASADMARAERADLAILHTMPLSVPMAGMAWSGGAYSPTMMEIDRVELQSSLGKLHEMADASGVPDADCMCQRGSAADQIRETAERIHADLIVLGSHRHGRLFHTMFGSVRDDLLSSAPCPVLVLPPKTKPS
jgi:nucleotide-binding universal stress UspA family protein